jgi:hypothetical protein
MLRATSRLYSVMPRTPAPPVDAPPIPPGIPGIPPMFGLNTWGGDGIARSSTK